MTYKHPIGLFGGTFDPIHNGHLEIAQILMKQLNLQSLHFIPNKIPPHRCPPIASAHHRLTMARIATAHHHDFIVNDIEIARPSPSYTIDTLTTLRALIPLQPICFIMGMDQFIHFNKWFHWEKIAELAHLVIINRQGCQPSNIGWMDKLIKKNVIKQPLLLGSHLGGKIIFIDINPISISSTEIRQKIQHEEDVSNELPSEVINYIKEHQLYSE